MTAIPPKIRYIDCMRSEPIASTRREFVKSAMLTTAAIGLPLSSSLAATKPSEGERPRQDKGIAVINPWGGRVPASFIIDDSTCLVNMAYFGLPQFMEAWPGHRKKFKDTDWKNWPQEIPDSFVLKFGAWCRENGVKGKYSIVPFPTCVGWVDRVMPGWSRTELRESLKLVREFMMPDWDIHPEMITHTRVIDLKTGRPFEQKADGTYWMENGGWTGERSVDEIANYIAYSLKILKNVDLPCEGFTTPGGFGNPRQDRLSLAGMQAVKSVFDVDLPHYFKYVEDRGTNTQPRVEFAKGLKTGSPECIVNVPSCTGDWFGGWTGIDYGEEAAGVDRLITEDGKKGRMIEVIEAGAPAAMLCHWPGIYCNGEEVGYRIFQGAVKRVNAKYGKRVVWMKVSEMARYWAAKELTELIRQGNGAIILNAPYTASGYSLRINAEKGKAPTLVVGEEQKPVALTEVKSKQIGLGHQEWRRSTGSVEICFDLPKGVSRITMA